MRENIWRYCVNGFGGIVMAETKELAESKIKSAYKHMNSFDEFSVWNIEDDDYFNKDYPDVWECYGI